MACMWPAWPGFEVDMLVSSVRRGWEVQGVMEIWTLLLCVCVGDCGVAVVWAIAHTCSSRAAVVPGGCSCWYLGSEEATRADATLAGTGPLSARALAMMSALEGALWPPAPPAAPALRASEAPPCSKRARSCALLLVWKAGSAGL